jgi:hypothetical protein
MPYKSLQVKKYWGSLSHRERESLVFAIPALSSLVS